METNTWSLIKLRLARIEHDARFVREQSHIRDTFRIAEAAKQIRLEAHRILDELKK